MAIDLNVLSWKCWEAALSEARDAVLFLDNDAAITLRWNGGVARALDAGVKKIKDFSAFELGDTSDKKALFIISEDLLSAKIQSIVNSVLHASCFEVCIVISAMPIRSTPERTSQQQIRSMQRELREWMGNVEDTVSKIVHIPLVMSCVLGNVAVLTPFDKFFPPLMPEQSSGQLPFEQRLVLDQIVGIVSALLDTLGLRDRLFSIGKFSYTVADELEHSPVTGKRRSTLESDTGKASLIFVDRSLDVVLPLSFQRDSLLDTMRSVLPAFDSTDVAIDMSPVCHARCEKLSSGYTVARGSLSCLPIMTREKLHNLNWKQITGYLREEFESLAEFCDLSDQLEADDGDTLEFVKKNLKAFRKSRALEDSIHSLVELVAITELLTAPELHRRNEKLAIEKAFMQNATGNILCGALDAGDALVQLMQARDKANLSLADLVGLIFYLHSLSGEELYIDQRSRESVRAELLNALTEEVLRHTDEWSELARILVPSLKATETELQWAVQKIEEAASRLSKQRVKMKQYRNILLKGDLTSPAKYKPLLRELFDDMKIGIDVSDLEEHSSSLDGLKMLKGGLGFLMNMKSCRANPFADAEVIVLVALGGITLAEVKLLEEFFAEGHMQLLVLTTSLLTAEKTVNNILSAMVS